jgi:hypothetical protein
MAPITTPGPTLTVRPLQYRDLDDLKQWQPEELEAGGDDDAAEAIVSWLDHQRRWYGPLKVLSWLPRSMQQQSQATFVAERQKCLVGLIQVSPFNQTRSTWRVEQVVVNRRVPGRHCGPGQLGLHGCGFAAVAPLL